MGAPLPPVLSDRTGDGPHAAEIHSDYPQVGVGGGCTDPVAVAAKGLLLFVNACPSVSSLQWTLSVLFVCRFLVGGAIHSFLHAILTR